MSVRGGVHHLVFEATGARADPTDLQGGAVNVAFDQQRFGAVGGELVLASPGFGEAAAKYDVNVSGGPPGC